MSQESPEQLIERIGIKPTLTPYGATGYHGTDEAGASSILKDGIDLSQAKEGLYGRGFYFYEDSAPHPGVDAAMNFLKTRRSFPKVAVLTVDVTVEGNFLFDIVSSPENRAFFDEIQAELIKMAERAGALSSFNPRLMGTATVEFIVRHCPETRIVYAVRASFEMRNMSPPWQRGGCVRHAKCIANAIQVALN